MSYLANKGNLNLEYSFFVTDYTTQIKSDDLIHNSQLIEEKITQSLQSSFESTSNPSSPVNKDFEYIFFPFSTSDFEEIKKLLNSKIFTNHKNIYESKITEHNCPLLDIYRSYVSSSLNQGLFEIIYKYVKGEDVILEIGSGVGYSIWDKLAPSIIRTQSCFKECQLLSESTLEPVYQMNIEEIYETLVMSKIKIPLFFALNVFDKLSDDIREKSLIQISELQNVGDRLLILLDSYPSIEEMYKKFEEFYPDHVAMPYVPYSLTTLSKISFILVPRGINKTKFIIDDYLKFIEIEYRNLANGTVSEIQKKLHILQEQNNFQIIAIEDFFVLLMKKNLSQVGYKTDVYYHTSFTTGKLEALHLDLDLLYKPVTDIEVVRQWSINDQKFLGSLNNKNIRFPRYINENFITELRSKGHKIMGAEILAIEATKL